MDTGTKVVLGAGTVVGAGLIIYAVTRGTAGLKPGGTLPAKFKFMYEGPTREFTFYVGIGTGTMIDKFIPSAEWEKNVSIKESRDKSSLREVKLELGIPKDMIKGTYDAMAQIMTDTKIYATDMDSEAIIIE